MPLLAFKPEFTWLILNGEKTSTIRMQGKRPGPRVKPGGLLYLYSGRYTNPDYHMIGVARVDDIMRVKINLEDGKPVLRTAGNKTPEAEPYYKADWREIERIVKKEGFYKGGVASTQESKASFFAFFDLAKKGDFDGWLYDFTLIEKAKRYESAIGASGQVWYPLTFKPQGL